MRSKCGGENAPLVLKEGGEDSTRTLVFTPRGVLKQGGLDSTGGKSGGRKAESGGVAEEGVRKSFAIPPEMVGIMETGIFLVLVSGRRRK